MRVLICYWLPMWPYFPHWQFSLRCWLLICLVMVCVMHSTPRSTNKFMNKHSYQVRKLPQGPRNSITDVAGVQVGHQTLDQDAQQTGVTVVLPHNRDPFLYKVTAGLCIINGFGKSVGLIQIQELGQLETHIVLTNT